MSNRNTKHLGFTEEQIAELQDLGFKETKFSRLTLTYNKGWFSEFKNPATIMCYKNDDIINPHGEKLPFVFEYEEANNDPWGILFYLPNFEALKNVIKGTDMYLTNISPD